MKTVAFLMSIGVVFINVGILRMAIGKVNLDIVGRTNFAFGLILGFFGGYLLYAGVRRFSRIIRQEVIKSKAM